MKQTTPERNEPTPRFHNHPYHAEVISPVATSVMVKIIPLNPTGPSGRRREVSAFAYELAAAMERRSEELGAEWGIVVDSSNARITIELTSDSESEQRAAEKFAEELLVEWNLA